MTARGNGVVDFAAGLAIAMSASIAGCSLILGDLVPVPTAPPVVPDENGAVECLTAATGGQLVAHPDWGIALEVGGEPMPVLWPHGYVGRLSGDRVELLDDQGRVVARTGDRIQGGGGQATIDGVEGWIMCPIGIEMVQGG